MTGHCHHVHNDEHHPTTAHCAGVPIPDADAAAGARIEAAIQQALGESDRRKISGAEVTPFLLKRIQELTGGASLAANVRLIKNNAAVGAQIAVELARRT